MGQKLLVMLIILVQPYLEYKNTHDSPSNLLFNENTEVSERKKAFRERDNNCEFSYTTNILVDGPTTFTPPVNAITTGRLSRCVRAKHWSYLNFYTQEV